ncbi:MAG: hypothetical protein ABI305_14295 [Tepidiformaceae bacterium]
MSSPVRPSLAKQIRRLAKVGIPCLLSGAASITGAIWWGLDYTGIVALVLGVVLLLLGAYLTFVIITSMVAVLEAKFRTRGRPARAVITSPPQPGSGSDQPAPLPVDSAPAERPGGPWIF